MPAKQRDTDAATAVIGAMVELMFLTKGFKYLFADGLGLCGSFDFIAAQIFQDHDKLVAAKSGYGVAFTHTAAKALRHLRQQDVALPVPQGVVKALEVVQINEQQSAQLLMSCSSCASLRQPVHQQAPIGQMRQGVVVGQIIDSVRGLFALADVAVKGLDQRFTVGNNLARRYLQRHDVPILVVVLDFKSQGLAGQDAFESTRQSAQGVGRVEVAQIQALQVLRLVTVHAREGLVGSNNGAVRSQDENTVTGPAEKELKTLIAHSQFALSLHARCDVLRNPDRTERSSICGQGELRLLTDPAQGVADPDPVFMIKHITAQS